jgi:hypothetical protein
MGVRLFSTNTVTTRIAQTAKRVTIFKWVVCAKLCDTLIIDIQSHDGYKRPPFQRSNSTLQTVENEILFNFLPSTRLVGCRRGKLSHIFYFYFKSLSFFLLEMFRPTC